MLRKFQFYGFFHGLISEKLSTKIIENDLLGVVVKYAVVQLLRKKTCVLTEISCVLLVFIFPYIVWCWWHIIKQIFHAYFMFDIEIIHPR